jgi:hypothetical protein
VYAVGESDLPADDMAGPDERFLARLASLIDPTLSENKTSSTFFRGLVAKTGSNLHYY